jgi:hypothetical protein
VLTPTRTHSINHGTARKSEASRWSKPLTEPVFCVVLVCVPCFSASLSCFGRANQRVEEPLSGTASPVVADLPKIEGQDGQSTPPAKSIAVGPGPAGKKEEPRRARGVCLASSNIESRFGHTFGMGVGEAFLTQPGPIGGPRFTKGLWIDPQPCVIYSHTSDLPGRFASS